MRCWTVPLPDFEFLVEEAVMVLLAWVLVGMESDRLNAAGLNVSIVVDMVEAPPGRTAQGGIQSFIQVSRPIQLLE